MASVIRQAKPDKICGETRSVLCVNSMLMAIATTTKIIERIANDIEKHILSTSRIGDKLNALMEMEVYSIHAQLPKSKYHDRFGHSNNIDKEVLGHLLKEAHDAMSYYYNSIVDMIKTNEASEFKTDPDLQEIRNYLSNDIICRYRSILAVYSLEWPLTNQVNRIQFSRDLDRQAPSTIFYVRSLVVSNLLQEWMRRLRSVIDNLDKKYF